MSDLLDAARDAAADAYAPYSDYPVGAALRTSDGAVYVGCNIETANYSNTLHAEEVAIARAISHGHRDFEALAVASAARDGLTPCGSCRQTLVEFCDPELPVHTDKEGQTVTYTLGELLPASGIPGVP